MGQERKGKGCQRLLLQYCWPAPSPLSVIQDHRLPALLATHCTRFTPSQLANANAVEFPSVMQVLYGIGDCTLYLSNRFQIFYY